MGRDTRKKNRTRSILTEDADLFAQAWRSGRGVELNPRRLGLCGGGGVSGGLMLNRSSFGSRVQSILVQVEVSRCLGALVFRFFGVRVSCFGMRACCRGRET